MLFYLSVGPVDRMIMVFTISLPDNSGYFICCSVHLNVPCFLAYIFPYFVLAAMAGLAPEGSQFDSRQYDSKMNEM